MSLSAVFCPDGCPDDDVLTVSAKEVTLFTLKQAWFSTWTAKDGSLIFTSYDDFDPASICGHDVTGSEARVVIKLKTAEGSNVGKGCYDANDKKDPKPAHQVPELPIST